MSQSLQFYIPGTFDRYTQIAAIQQLQVGDRLNLDENTYVMRHSNQYVAYRNWLTIVPLIEVFDPGEAAAVMEWLEQFGYSVTQSS